MLNRMSLQPPRPAPGPGRPKDPGKHAAIIAAAGTLFFARGFSDVTMEAVAAAAGVSKMTVYSHFGDKEALFEAVVQWHMQALLAQIRAFAAAEGPLADRLAAVGRSFLALVCSPKVVAADRTLVQMLNSNPSLAQRFYQAGPGQMRASLAESIAAAASRGELSVDSALDAADDLLSLWCGNLPRLLALGVIAGVTPAEIDTQIDRTTAVFLRAYAPQSVAAPVAAAGSEPASRSATVMKATAPGADRAG